MNIAVKIINKIRGDHNALTHRKFNTKAHELSNNIHTTQ